MTITLALGEVNLMISAFVYGGWDAQGYRCSHSMSSDTRHGVPSITIASGFSDMSGGVTLQENSVMGRLQGFLRTKRESRQFLRIDRLRP